MTLFGLALMRLLGFLPLFALRALALGLGVVLFVLARPRRHVVLTNLRLCFPELDARERRVLGRRVFVAFVQAWLDRAWLWRAPEKKLRQRLHLHGAVQELQGSAPTIVFLPHFMGLDAAGTALSLLLDRPIVSIFTAQLKPHLDRWIEQGRRRWGRVTLLTRMDGPKPILQAVRAGQLFFLLPDMDFGPKDTLFAPFFGTVASTTPSLHRFAKLGPAKVVPVLARISPRGYEIEVLPAWKDFPSADVQSDTTRMNRELEAYVRTMPEQYYWVHKRFKTRPVGEPDCYAPCPTRDEISDHPDQPTQNKPQTPQAY